jgi:hypothetical protein
VLISQFFDHRGGADLQHACRVPNAAGIHRHLDDLFLNLRRLPGIAVVQQKGAPASFAALAAAIMGFALTGRAVSDNIRALAVRTVQGLETHGGTRLAWGITRTVTHSERIAYQHL